MPSLKMKMKSTTGCLREKNGLHVCPKSSKISKKSSLDIKNFQQEAQLQTCISNKQDDCFCNEVTIEEISSSEASCCEFLDEEHIHVQKHLSPSNDDATLYGMDHTQATCPSTIETIFSPIPESINNDNEEAASDDRGSLKDLAVPSPGDNNSDASSRNSCDYQSCNVSDFFISDMFVSLSPTERSSAYAVTEATCLPDYECDGSSRFFDDECMILPFLEESVETGNDCDDNTICSEPVMVSEESSLHLAIHQLRSNPEPDVDTYHDWDPAECLDPLMFIRTLPDLSESETNFNPTILAREKNPITLVLDLDETLVHSSLEHCDDADFTFPVFIDFKEHTVYVKQRPYLREFLERVSEMFQIVVFTASQSVYAKQLLDILDPDGKIISRRAYRESCIFADGSYTKDLTVLGVNLAKVAIIDNSPQVFRWQVNNGIPIKSWFDDPSDCALISLLPFLETLVNAEDVRPIIAKRFGNKEQVPLVSHYFT